MHGLMDSWAYSTYGLWHTDSLSKRVRERESAHVGWKYTEKKQLSTGRCSSRLLHFFLSLSSFCFFLLFFSISVFVLYLCIPSLYGMCIVQCLLWRAMEHRVNRKYTQTSCWWMDGALDAGDMGGSRRPQESRFGTIFVFLYVRWSRFTTDEWFIHGFAKNVRVRILCTLFVVRTECNWHTQHGILRERRSHSTRNDTIYEWKREMRMENSWMRRICEWMAHERTKKKVKRRMECMSFRGENHLTVWRSGAIYYTLNRNIHFSLQLTAHLVTQLPKLPGSELSTKKVGRNGNWRRRKIAKKSDDGAKINCDEN